MRFFQITILIIVTICEEISAAPSQSQEDKNDCDTKSLKGGGKNNVAIFVIGQGSALKPCEKSNNFPKWLSENFPCLLGSLDQRTSFDENTAKKGSEKHVKSNRIPINQNIITIIQQRSGCSSKTGGTFPCTSSLLYKILSALMCDTPESQPPCQHIKENGHNPHLEQSHVDQLSDESDSHEIVHHDYKPGNCVTENKQSDTSSESCEECSEENDSSQSSSSEEIRHDNPCEEKDATKRTPSDLKQDSGENSCEQSSGDSCENVSEENKLIQTTDTENFPATTESVIKIEQSTSVDFIKTLAYLLALIRESAPTSPIAQDLTLKHPEVDQKQQTTEKVAIEESKSDSGEKSYEDYSEESCENCSEEKKIIPTADAQSLIDTAAIVTEKYQSTEGVDYIDTLTHLLTLIWGSANTPPIAESATSQRPETDHLQPPTENVVIEKPIPETSGGASCEECSGKSCENCSGEKKPIRTVFNENLPETTTEAVIENEQSTKVVDYKTSIAYILTLISASASALTKIRKENTQGFEIVQPESSTKPTVQITPSIKGGESCESCSEEFQEKKSVQSDDSDDYFKKISNLIELITASKPKPVINLIKTKSREEQIISSCGTLGDDQENCHEYPAYKPAPLLTDQNSEEWDSPCDASKENCVGLREDDSSEESIEEPLNILNLEREPGVNEGNPCPDDSSSDELGVNDDAGKGPIEDCAENDDVKAYPVGSETDKEETAVSESGLNPVDSSSVTEEPIAVETPTSIITNAMNFLKSSILLYSSQILTGNVIQPVLGNTEPPLDFQLPGHHATSDDIATDSIKVIPTPDTEHKKPKLSKKEKVQGAPTAPSYVVFPDKDSWAAYQIISKIIENEGEVNMEKYPKLCTYLRLLLSKKKDIKDCDLSKEIMESKSIKDTLSELVVNSKSDSYLSRPTAAITTSSTSVNSPTSMHSNFQEIKDHSEANAQAETEGDPKTYVADMVPETSASSEESSSEEDEDDSTLNVQVNQSYGSVSSTGNQEGGSVESESLNRPATPTFPNSKESSSEEDGNDSLMQVQVKQNYGSMRDAVGNQEEEEEQEVPREVLPTADSASSYNTRTSNESSSVESENDPKVNEKVNQHFGALSDTSNKEASGEDITPLKSPVTPTSPKSMENSSEEYENSTSDNVQASHTYGSEAKQDPASTPAAFTSEVLEDENS